MIVEYDISCFERTLQIKFPDRYEYLKEEIIEMLDGFYFEWHDAENIEDEEERLAVLDSCLEEYMMDRLSETHNMWEEWDTDYYGDDAEEKAIETVPVKNEDQTTKRENLWVCEHCLCAIESREGNQATLVHYIDEDDEESTCDWCGFDECDKLYELI